MSRPPLLRVTLCAVLLCVSSCHASAVSEASAASHRIAATDLLRLKRVEAPALSPDGRLVVYVVRSIEPKADSSDDWTYHTHLWLAATDGSAPPRRLTTGATQNTAPAWHPDGRRIAFVRSGATPGERGQIHVLSLDGGEAEPWTNLDTGAAAPRWSPDGTKLLFSSTLTHAQVRDALEKSAAPSRPHWDLERPGREPNDTGNWPLLVRSRKGAGPSAPPARAELPRADPDGSVAEIREWLARQEAEGNPRLTTRYNFLAEGDLETDFRYAQLHVIDARPGAAPVLLVPGYAARTSPAWLADSRRIAFIMPRSDSTNPDRERLRSLAVVDTADGSVRVLLAGEDETYNDPAPSPDGRWIAFTVQEGGLFSFEPARVAVVPAEGGPAEVLTARLDRNAQNLKWDPRSRAIHFTAPSEGRFPLYRVPLDKRELQALTWQPGWGVRDYDVGPDGLVQVITEPGNPSELHAAHASGKVSRPITTHNASWLAGKKLAAYEAHQLERDGLRIPYWTIRPTDFDPAKKYPLLVQIHGGPSAMWGPGEESMWFEFQFFAARGYAIVFSNPRGSGGYGRDFQKANHRDWGAGPAADVLAAADAVARQPWVDSTRQFVTGGSYGGYLTAWIVAHDHRFRAAVAQRGVYDLVTFFGEGNAWALLPRYFGGYPWEPEVRAVLERESPLTYVTQIRTPLLIQHGDVDYRTGVIQSQMLYKSLKALGRPVEYVRYPRATHEMSRSGEPRQRLDSLVRYEEFFRRHFGEN